MATEEVPEGAEVTGDQPGGDIESSGAIGVSFKDDGDGGDPAAALKKSDPFAAAGIPPSPYKDRPLGWHSAIEQSVYYYNENPLFHSVIFLLVLMVFDRTGMWGTSYTNVPFLTGYYNNNFNPGMGANEAARFSSTGMIVAYITPFFTALLADGLFGDFSTIFILMACFSLPGLILTLISAYPGLLSQTFGMQNQEIMRVGMLIFYPIGNGGMNTLNDIFSAKQYHPVLQKDLVEKYFVWSGVASAAAALIAQLLISTVAAFNYVVSIGILAIFQFIAIVVFLAGRKRYVRRRTDRLKVTRFLKAMFLCCLPVRHKSSDEEGMTYKPAIPGPHNLREARGGNLPDKFVDGFVRLLWIIPFQLLGLGSNICMFAFMNLGITQSFAMKKGAVWGGSQMLMFMSISAIISGQVLNTKIFPWMHSKGYKFPTGHKLAVAGFFYALGYILFCIIDLQIHRVWNESGEQISIWWQVFPLLPIGVAVIMTVPTLDSFVFLLSPTEFKTLGNAINKLVQVALANQIVKSLYKVCAPWFENKLGGSDISNTEFYVQAQIWKFFLVMAGWGALLIVLGLFPPTQTWLRYMESLTTPKILEESDEPNEANDVEPDENEGESRVDSSFLEHCNNVEDVKKSS